VLLFLSKYHIRNVNVEHVVIMFRCSFCMYSLGIQ